MKELHISGVPPKSMTLEQLLRRAPVRPDVVLLNPNTAKALWPEHALEIDVALNEGWGLFGFGGPF